MSGKKRWQSRLSSHPHLPDIKEIPEAMRVRRGDRSEEPKSTKLARDCHTIVQRAKRYLLEDLDSKLV